MLDQINAFAVPVFKKSVSALKRKEIYFNRVASRQRAGLFCIRQALNGCSFWFFLVMAAPFWGATIRVYDRLLSLLKDGS